jgi:hypothetical protein
MTRINERDWQLRRRALLASAAIVLGLLFAALSGCGGGADIEPETILVDQVCTAPDWPGQQPIDCDSQGKSCIWQCQVRIPKPLCSVPGTCS